MILDFLSVEWGGYYIPHCEWIKRLQSAFSMLTRELEMEQLKMLACSSRREEPRWLFHQHQAPGSSWHGPYSLWCTVTGESQALLMFDNAPSYQKQAEDALLARKMPKGPKNVWPTQGPWMQDRKLPNSQPQLFCYPANHTKWPGWFKGMEQFIRECGQWPKCGKLNTQCKSFKCKKGAKNCRCCQLLFTSPDFIGQKSALEKMIVARGHLCNFYPKYHCELNYIEMYWGAVKFKYCWTPKTSNIDVMEANVWTCLDAILWLTLLRWVLSTAIVFSVWSGHRFANRAVWFISAWAAGCTGMDTGYLKKKYRGHQMLPAGILREVRAAVDSL